MKWRLMIFVILGLMLAVSAQARVKLVALPQREAVKIRLDNPEATLVQEERLLTLQQGSNQIDFSWKGVRIEPESIRIRPLDHPEKVRLISVSYPPDEDALVWQVYSEQAIEARVRISYLLSGIDRLLAYKAIADKQEEFLDFQSHLVLRNFSGEDFRAARCRLGFGQVFEMGIKNRATKRMLFLQEPNIPIKKQLVWDAAKKPHEPEKVKGNVGIPVKYVIQNSQKSGLGRNAFFPGKARIFQQDGHGSTIFLGEDRASFTPVGARMELAIGKSRDVTVTQRRMQTKNTDIRRDDDGNIQVYDQICRDKIEIKNFKDEQVSLTIIEHIKGQWQPIDFSHDYQRKDHATLHFKLELPAQGEETINMHYKLRNIFAQRYQAYNRVLLR
jgi:hypothetical protein